MPVAVVAVALTAFLALLVHNLGWLSDDWFLAQRATGPWLDVWTSRLASTRGEGAYYRPLVPFSIAIEHRLFGGSIGAMHFTSVRLHAMCSLLVFRLACELVPSLRQRIATVASAPFFVLPIHTDVNS